MTEKNLRAENQDAFAHYDTPYGPLFIVADGMGGRRGGREAAILTTRGIRENLIHAHHRGLSRTDALIRAANQTSRMIFLRGQSGNGELEGMGATVVLALGDLGAMTIAHVGDSRAYHVTRDDIHRLTKDHTRVQEWLDAGVLTEKEAQNHPESCMITRAMGVEPDVRLEVRQELVQVNPNEGLLLCSDGLSSFVEDDLIFDCLRSTKDKRRCAQRLVSLAKACQSDDNITVLYVHQPKLRWFEKAVEPGSRDASSVGKTLTLLAALVTLMVITVLVAWGWIERYSGADATDPAGVHESNARAATPQATPLAQPKEAVLGVCLSEADVAVAQGVMHQAEVVSLLPPSEVAQFRVWLMPRNELREFVAFTPGNRSRAEALASALGIPACLPMERIVGGLPAHGPPAALAIVRLP